MIFLISYSLIHFCISMSLKSSVKLVFRITVYIFLITLPFTFQAYIAGALFAKYHNDNIATGIELWVHELDHFSWMNQFSVPGASSILDYQHSVGPFQLPQLRTHNWRNKLGLTIPYEHIDWLETDLPIDRHAAFDEVVRDLSCHRNMPTEYWVYVSSLSMPEVYE